jgi:hypothetical protein
MLTNRGRIAAALILAAGVLAVGGRHHRKAEAAPAPPAAKVPTELLEKRRDMAENVFKQKTLRYRAGQGLPSELFGWSERWLEAELALSDKKADQTAALQAHVDRTRELERLATTYARTGQGM